MRAANTVLFNTAFERKRHTGKWCPSLIVCGGSGSLLLFLQEIAPQNKEPFFKFREIVFIAA
jgi:hypothetical protein